MTEINLAREYNTTTVIKALELCSSATNLNVNTTKISCAVTYLQPNGLTALYKV